ncbi:VCBS repeat-containing protein [Polaribacter sp. R2A056_3_33]|uniref:VCBS repeat-containing protein n=1 Tax=Polaribacter sp. R2A056_3_33 TaxID=2745563 RepID=UPI001C4EDDA9|nr:VCBS repeat-containing protein [Polaribacter sp. R2A056_3_33]QXP70794.1 VCBS repeat-containing protein [Polaribacter sp. R2A056_3_33]
MKAYFKHILLLLTIITLWNCTSAEKEINIESTKIFSQLKNTNTNIDFQNILTENDSINYFTYSYIYMGGGVSVGDINNDGLPDLYFTGNQVSNKLYLNKGNLQFEDITDKAGVSGSKEWHTGVTMADVNNDGFLDIYCSVSGKFGSKKNQLFINNKDNTFTEQAQKYGLADEGNSINATFFDYDNDGDLDVYVANYPPLKFSSPAFVYQMKMKNVKKNESDHLYRNDGNTFTNVTDAAGLKSFGLSLSATVGDLNNDGWQDLYVSNDFSSPDFMYINQKDGTFKEVVKKTTAHTAFYGMGVDIADFNNDGNLDIFQVDMDAKSNRRQKSNMASMNPDLFWSVVDAGFHYQYMQNCFQVNSGVFTDGNPYFSNVSRITGTSSTDWSWGPLMADFDNDGLKDVFITNGTRREVNNRDFFNKLEDANLGKEKSLEMSLQIPSEKIDNFIFKNNGNLNFEKANKKWGIEYKGFSNGAVYADLDNDGDLEIITNNIDDYAAIFENTSAEKSNFLKVNFKGGINNKFGLGNRVYVKTADKTQMQELTLTRGFQSSVAPELHFGLGATSKIEEVKVVWQNGNTQTLNNVEANNNLVFNYDDATKPIIKEEKEQEKLFVTENSVFPKYKHEENKHNDFDTQVLLPHKMSSLGPALAIGDLNNDGLEDYFIGGSKGKTGSLFYQTKTGFTEASTSFLEEDILSEDLGALIFDADADGDNDLYVVSGGYEFDAKSELLQDRLYLNDGKGNFVKAKKGTLPEFISSGSKVYSADFDKDSKEDLLVLGRQTPGQYPLPTTTYLLKNVGSKGNAKFEFFSDDFSKPFKDLGMATSAVITDYNNDNWLDIIVVGEWMPIKVFKNNKNSFVDVSKKLGLDKNTTGWWWSINEGDFDNDGDTDYILGNNGLNYKYQANKNESFDIFVNDFDKNKKQDIVLSYYNEGKQYPVRGRSCSSQQIPGIKKKFKNYESFSEATLIDVYSDKALESALHYKVKSFASIYLENKNGKLIVHKLPQEVQISSINEIIVKDFNDDGNLDALIAGNLQMSEVETPRNDASYGGFLEGDGTGAFKAISGKESGFFASGDVKGMGAISKDENKYIIVVRNNEEVSYLKINK